MLIYKFKIINDENENFYREIEIKPGNTFKDFHDLLGECIKFNPGEMASFYICDNKWNKIQEISLVDMGEPEDKHEVLDKETKPVKLMTNVKLKESIIDPNQRMIYVYDFLKMHTFYIELSKITEGDEKVNYPRCTKSVSDIAKPKKIIPKNEEIEEEAEEAEEESDEFFNEDDTNFDEGDLNLGEGFEETKLI
jgi:hypothetical protein